MRKKRNELDRRAFIKRTAKATAAGAAVLSTGMAHGAVPEDKKIEFQGTLPSRVLGKMDVELPILGYGGAALPRKWGNTLSFGDRVKLVRYAYDRGIRYFDTAISYTYSESQPIIGRALKDVRDNVFITTKIDFWDKAHADGHITKVRKEDVGKQVEMNMQELQTDYLDAVMIHGTPGVEQMTVEQSMEVHGELVKLRDQGIIRFIGFSAHGYFDKALALISTGGFDLCMPAYGYFPRGMDQIFSPRMIELREACLAKAHELKMGIVAMKVLAAGMLCGFGQKHLRKLPGAACRYAAQDDRIHILNIGMRFPAEIDANIEALAADAAYTDDDRTLLAEFSSALLDADAVKKMRVE